MPFIILKGDEGSDVGIRSNNDSSWTCVDCSLSEEGGNVQYRDPKLLIGHLYEHGARHEVVPLSVWQALDPVTDNG